MNVTLVGVEDALDKHGFTRLKQLLLQEKHITLRDALLAEAGRAVVCTSAQLKGPGGAPNRTPYYKHTFMCACS